MPERVLFCLFSCVGKKSKMTSTLDSGCQLSLMLCANACYTARKDFTSLGSVAAELTGILVVDVLGFFYAERTDLLATFSHAAAFFSIVCHCNSSKKLIRTGDRHRLLRTEH